MNYAASLSATAQFRSDTSCPDGLNTVSKLSKLLKEEHANWEINFASDPKTLLTDRNNYQISHLI